MGDNRSFGVVEEDEIDFGDEDETDQAKVLSEIVVYGLLHILLTAALLYYPHLYHFLIFLYVYFCMQHYLESNEKYYMMAHR